MLDAAELRRARIANPAHGIERHEMLIEALRRAAATGRGSRERASAGGEAVTTATEIDRVPALDADLVVRALALALSQTLDDAGRRRVRRRALRRDRQRARGRDRRAGGGPGAVHAFYLPAEIAPQRRGSRIARGRRPPRSRSRPSAWDPLVEAAPSPPGARRRGNFAARMRMAILYDRAAASTPRPRDQQQERDRAGLHDPVGRHGRRLLAARRSLQAAGSLDVARSIGLPAAVVERAPSAELWDGQTDEAELGFSYVHADLVLYNYLEGRRRPDDITGPGIDADTVERVLDGCGETLSSGVCPGSPS